MSTTRTIERDARFGAVVDAVYEPLQRYLGRRASPEDASEVLNDALLTLWRRLDDVPRDDPLPWAYGVAKRSLANHRRGEVRRLRLVERAAGRWRADRAEDPVWTSPEEGALSAALRELGEADREIVRLWAWERLEPRDIALVLDTTPNAVSLRLSRIKHRLAASMERQDRAAAGQKTVGHGKEHRA